MYSVCPAVLHLSVTFSKTIIKSDFNIIFKTKTVCGYYVLEIIKGWAELEGTVDSVPRARIMYMVCSNPVRVICIVKPSDRTWGEDLPVISGLQREIILSSRRVNKRSNVLSGFFPRLPVDRPVEI